MDKEISYLVVISRSPFLIWLLSFARLTWRFIAVDFKSKLWLEVKILLWKTRLTLTIR